MNELREDMRRSLGYRNPPTLQQIIEKRGALLTEGQIETAGKAYVRATVWTRLADLMIDGLRLIGRTVWLMATITTAGLAIVWLAKHWPAILLWL